MRELMLIALSGQPDIEVVAEVQDEADIPTSVEKTNPDFIIVTQDSLGERPSVCDVLFCQRPDVGIIAIIPHLNRSVYYWATVNISSRDVEASEEAFLNVLRTRIRSSAALT